MNNRDFELQELIDFDLYIKKIPWYQFIKKYRLMKYFNKLEDEFKRKYSNK